MSRYATREVFCTTALEILAGPGLPALRIGPLCREVGVTSGSFYHHFGSWDGFVVALLAHWRREWVDRVLDSVRAQPDPVERVALLRRFALAVPHDAETAIRNWAGSDTVVAAAQQQVDESRRAALCEVLAPLVVDDELTATLAEVGLSILVGYQQRGQRPDGAPPVALEALFEQYALLVQAHVVEDLDQRVGARLGS